MGEKYEINQSSFTTMYEWSCPNCHANHVAFDWKPSGKAGLYCVECHAVIDVIEDVLPTNQEDV